MHARYFSIFFLFTLLVAVFATPIPEPEPMLSADDTDSEVAARDTHTLETRASGRVSLFTFYFLL
jgi:hypothetical protein